MQTHIAYLSTEQKTRSTGVRVLEPPSDTRQAVRGNLYAVIEFAEYSPEQSQLIEHALSIIQRTYYSVKGTQTFVLTEALREALNLFHSMSPSAEQSAQPATTTARSRATPLSPGILLLSLIGDRLMMVGTGPIVALVTTGSSVDVYPNYTPGAERTANQAIDIYRQKLTSGGAFLLAGQRCLQHFTLRELASIVAYVTEDNLADVASALRNQAGAEPLTGLLTVISPDDVDDASAITRSQPLGGAARRRGGLPAALSAVPPARSVGPRTQTAETGLPYEEPRPAPSPGEDPEYDEHSEAGLTAAPLQPHADPSTDGNIGLGKLEERFVKGAQSFWKQAGVAFGALVMSRQTDRSTTPPAEPSVSAGIQGEATDGQSQSQFDTVAYDRSRAASVHDELYGDTAATADTYPADTYTADTYTAGNYTADSLAEEAYVDDTHREPPPSMPPMQESMPPYDAWQADQDLPAAQGMADEGTPSASARGQQAVLTPWQPPAVPKRATGRRARLFALAAISILLLTIVIVASVNWVTGSRNVAAAERILDMAEASFLSAQGALDAQDNATARLKLTEAQALVNEATSVVGTRLEKADSLNARIEQEMAALLQIRPLQALAAPLVQFPPEAQPQRVIVYDQEIYILDTGRQLIQRYEMDPTNNVILNAEGATVLAQGDTIGGATVGRLVDVAWMPPIAGFDDKAYLLVLDGANNIFRYDSRVEGASRIELGGREELRTPSELQVYGDRLYLADSGTNQIYRYGRGDFATPPERWFGPQTQSNLSSLRAMAIDGDIWLLYEQGLLLRYRTGDQLQFSLESSFGQIQEPVDLAVGNQGNSLIYIADSAEDRILVFNKDGDYEHQLRAPEGDVLRNLRGISVDDVAGTMYILTQSFLFNHPLPN